MTIQEQLKQIREQTFKIECQVLEGGKLPTKAHFSDAGYDLYTPERVAIYPGEVLTIPLNIRFKFPSNCWGNITSKSGLGKKGLLVFAGVIDSGYRGVPCVTMSNIKMTSIHLSANREPIIIEAGQKIAQMIMSPYSDQFYIEQVDMIDTNTERGEGGFGSTGK